MKVKRIPQFMHSYVYEHYEMVFDKVTVDDNRRLGEVGQGFDLTKEWFTETRIEIAAHCLGAAIRATEVANKYAEERVQFGKPIRDFQAIEFMLADMAVEIMAAKSLLYRIAAEVTEGLDPKLVHARASAVKLYNSEMAGRGGGQGVADPRRARLYAGEPGGAALSRRPGRSHLGRHLGDPAHGDRRPDQEAGLGHLHRLGRLIWPSG